MGRRIFGVANTVFALLFLMSAGLQLNDPDPWRWVGIYLAAGIACLLAGWVRCGAWVALVVAAVCLAWAVALSPILTELRLSELAREMKATDPRIELGREFLGLLILGLWLVAAAVAYRKGPRER